MSNPTQTNASAAGTAQTTVFPNVGKGKQGVYIATLEKDRLGERVSPIVLLDYCGDIRAALRAYNEGNPDKGERILSNLA